MQRIVNLIKVEHQKKVLSGCVWPSKSGSITIYGYWLLSQACPCIYFGLKIWGEQTYSGLGILRDNVQKIYDEAISGILHLRNHILEPV